jgi:hypothetical protein
MQNVNINRDQPEGSKESNLLLNAHNINLKAQQRLNSARPQQDLSRAHQALNQLAKKKSTNSASRLLSIASQLTEFIPRDTVARKPS